MLRQVGLAVPDWAELLDLAPAVIYGVAFVAAWAESAPALGLLVPGQSVLVAAGFLSGQGKCDPFTLAALVIVGGFLGDSLGFILGRRWGVAPLYRLPGRLRLTEGGRIRLVNLFEGHGRKAIVLARFQPIGRAFGPYLAGAIGMRASSFVPAPAAASILAGAGLIGLGFLAGVGFERLSRTLGVSVVAAVTVLLVIVVVVGLRVRRRHADAEAAREAEE
jgi:membrane-associated protein